MIDERRPEGLDILSEIEDLSKKIVADSEFINDESIRIIGEGNRLQGRLQEIRKVLRPEES